MFVEGLFSFLSNGGTTAGERVYPLTLPQGVTLPAIAYFLVSNPFEHSHDGPSKLQHPRYQMDCWAGTYLEARILASELLGRIDGYKGMMGVSTVHAAFAEDERDNWDPDTGRHWVSVDVVVWNTG